MQRFILCCIFVVAVTLRAYGDDIHVASDPPAGAIEVGDRLRIGLIGADDVGQYVWKKNGSPLEDGGRISGAKARVLLIKGATDADVGAYTCVYGDGDKVDAELGPYQLQLVEIPTVAEPYNPVAAGEIPQYVFFWKANWSRPPLTAAYCRQITDAVGDLGHEKLRPGVSITLDLLNHDAETLLAWLEASFTASEESGLPLQVAIDGQNYWENRPDLWNWWNPEKPGYDPGNAQNVEWFGWGPENATKIAWRNWGNLHRLPPAPNLASFDFLVEHWEKYAKVVPAIMAWYDRLPEDRKYLFGGLKVGWEVGIIHNSFYFDNGNVLYEANPENMADDPKSGYGAHLGWTWGAQKTGYAAATTLGLKSEGTLTKADHETIIKGYLEKLSRVAVALGVPHHQLFTHQGAPAPWGNNISFEPAINGYAIPGYSFYHGAPETTPMGAALDKHGRAQFSNAETMWHDATQAEYEAHFRATLKPFGTGPKTCRNVVIYAWDTLNKTERENITAALHTVIEETRP